MNDYGGRQKFGVLNAPDAGRSCRAHGPEHRVTLLLRHQHASEIANDVRHDPEGVFLRHEGLREPMLLHHHDRVRGLELHQVLQRALGRRVDVGDGLRGVGDDEQHDVRAAVDPHADEAVALEIEHRLRYRSKGSDAKDRVKFNLIAIRRPPRRRSPWRRDSLCQSLGYPPDPFHRHASVRRGQPRRQLVGAEGEERSGLNPSSDQELSQPIRKRAD